jgi:cyclase
MHDRKRRKFIHVAAFAAAFFATLAVVSAQGPGGGGPPPQPLVVHQVKPNLYWIEGGGGNSSIIIGNSGVIVVDVKTTTAGATELLADIAKITPKPVTTAIVTHSDGDHVNGLQSFPKGVTIIAQENCKTEMQAAPNAQAGGALADRMPTRTVKKKEDLTIEGVHLRLLHFAPAHTSGDLMVYLPDDKVMLTGDIIATQTAYPAIHLEKNGTTDGWITTVRGMLATDATTFIPGHGNVQMKADIQKRLTDAVARRDQIKALVAQRKSLDEVRQSIGEPPPAARGAGGAQPAGPGRAAAPSIQDFTGVFYTELTTKKK